MKLFIKAYVTSCQSKCNIKSTEWDDSLLQAREGLRYILASMSEINAQI